jgi:alpha-glucosidase
VEQLTQYHTQFNVRFGGIRKPRLGNSANLVLAKKNCWLIGVPCPGEPANSTALAPAPAPAPLRDGDGRNLNYSLPAVRKWYNDNSYHFLKDGVDFWWNDEGETDYYTFWYWNQAQYDMLAQYDETARFFSISRSFNPGMARMGAALWTGDISVSWTDLATTPGYVLNWGLAGSPYVTCDIGGFSGGDDTPLLLTRWYQLGALMPMMRVHSTLADTPHFPFLYGDAAAAAMRKALDLRYTMLPLLYSVGHHAYNSGSLVNTPFLVAFPGDTVGATITHQWMVGETGVMAAPVVSEDNSVSVYFPMAGASSNQTGAAGAGGRGGADWFEFGTCTTHSAGSTAMLTGVAMDHVPVYVAAGSIVTVGPVVQYIEQLPAAAALNVQVYSGADATFEFFEDDGTTLSYQSATGAKKTTFTWTEATSTLTWLVSGGSANANDFVTVKLTYFQSGGTPIESAESAIGSKGSITAA